MARAERALTGRQVRFLRGRGHGLKAIVQVGRNGVSERVLRQVEECLLAHELIKIKVLENCPLDKKACAEAIAPATGAAVAQIIGRTLLLYRPHPESPVLSLPPSPAGEGD